MVNNAGDISPQIAAERWDYVQYKNLFYWVGTNGEAYIRFQRNPDGKFVFGMVPVNIDEGLLRDISTRTGGKYYGATTLEQLKVIYNEIDQLEKTKLDIKVFKRYKEMFRPFVLLGLLMLALSYIFRMYLLQFKTDTDDTTGPVCLFYSSTYNSIHFGCYRSKKQKTGTSTDLNLGW